MARIAWSAARMLGPPPFDGGERTSIPRRPAKPPPRGGPTSGGRQRSAGARGEAGTPRRAAEGRSASAAATRSSAAARQEQRGHPARRRRRAGAAWTYLQLSPRVHRPFWKSRQMRSRRRQEAPGRRRRRRAWSRVDVLAAVAARASSVLEVAARILRAEIRRRQRASPRLVAAVGSRRGERARLKPARALVPP